VRSPSRSAVPLASVGIISLGLLPTLGGPDQPLHWAITAGMTGFGALLLLRHRLRRMEAPLSPLTRAHAQLAGRALLWVSGAIGVLVVGIVLRQIAASGPIAALSLAMPVVSLGWLVSLGLKALRWPADSVDKAPATEERPSRRPPTWERVTPSGPTPSGGPGRHVSP
jgi:hypothetical protein